MVIKFKKTEENEKIRNNSIFDNFYLTYYFLSNIFRQMKLLDYYNSLDESAQFDFADRIPTSKDNLHIHWIGRRRIPRKKTFSAIANATDGLVSYREVVEHFYFSG